MIRNCVHTGGWLLRAAVLPILLTFALTPVRTQAADASTTSSLRILSLAPNITEMLFALECEELIVGVTDYCNFPPEAASKPRIGGYHNTSFERILALRPTLAVHMSSEQTLARRLERHGIECLLVQSETIGDIREGLLAVGHRLGVAERSRKIVDEIEKGLAEIRSAHEGKQRPTVLWVIGHPPGVLRDVYAAGPNTFLDEMLRAVGARNAIADSAVRYPVVSRESLMRNPPDVVIDTKPDAAPWSIREEERMTRLWREFLGIAGDQQLRVVFSDDRHLTIPGPSVAKSAAKLAGLIYGPEKTDHE